jgi:uncharacterized OB-fold protein
VKRFDPERRHEKPLPTPDADSQAYWKALTNGRLLLQHCGRCNNVQAYHQAICRKCGSTALERRPASGYATVYSFSVVHRAPGPAFKEDAPYAVLLVELDEGPRMISSLVGGKPEDVTFGMRMRLVCHSVTDEISLPRFTPINVETGGQGRPREQT